MLSTIDIFSFLSSEKLTMSIAIVKVNVQPLFSPSDFTLILPPFYLTKFWQITRPRPIPSSFTGRPLESQSSSLPQRLKSFSNSLGSMPLPVSMIATLICFLFKLQQDSTVIVPSLYENLSAFLIKFMSTCQNLRMSPRKNGNYFDLIGVDSRQFGCKVKDYWLC